MKDKKHLPEGKVTKVLGNAFALKGDDIDTDRIIPARFLKCVDFENVADHVFEDDRIELNGSHPFDLESNQASSILIVNSNFGCGSSREHAPQALMRWGIRAIIGESFAEIFYGNCLALGIPCLTANYEDIKSMQKSTFETSSQDWVLSLEKKLIKNTSNSWNLKIENRTLKMLLSGNWDATNELLSNDSKINKTIQRLPYLNSFNY